MKKTGIDHPKISEFSEILGISMSHAIGIMECLWHFTAKHSPKGDIGKWSDRAIADAVYWPASDSERLINALVCSRMIDVRDDVRLVVHDWSEHCEDSVHIALARKRELFADGKMPNMARLPKAERRKVLSDYKEKSEQKRFEHAQETHKSDEKRPALACALPKPAPKPLPKPATLPKQAAGVFANLSEADLRDDAKLAAWYAHATSRRKPVIDPSEENRIRVFAAAERALEAGDQPVGLFAWIVAGAKWDYITSDQVDRAARRVSAARAPPSDSALQVIASAHPPKSPP